MLESDNVNLEVLPPPLRQPDQAPCHSFLPSPTQRRVGGRSNVAAQKDLSLLPSSPTPVSTMIQGTGNNIIEDHSLIKFSGGVGDLPLASSTLPLDYSVPATIKAKIWSNTHIEFYDLLYPTKSKQIHNGCPSIGRRDRALYFACRGNPKLSTISLIGARPSPSSLPSTPRNSGTTFATYSNTAKTFARSPGMGATGPITTASSAS